MKANLEKLNRALLRYITMADGDAKQVKILHDIRVTARKLIVVMHPDDMLTLGLKKLIQSSNKLRDLDVFTSEILPLFPKKLHTAFKDIKLVLQDTRVEMNHDFKSLVSSEWLDDLPQTQGLSFITQQQSEANLSRHQMPLNEIEKRLKKSIRELNLLDLEDKQLHKIRLVIKRLHYQLERFYPKEKRSIALTKRMQEKLGTFHDFYQAIKLLKQHKEQIKAKAYKNAIGFLEEQKNQTIKELRKDIRKRL